MTTDYYPDRTPLRQRIKAIHSSGVSLAILASGGGFELLTELTAISGASAVLMDAATPYSKRALADHVKVPPSQIVNELFHQAGEHVNLFDEELLTWTLARAGFGHVERTTEAELLRRFPGFPARHDELCSIYVLARP